VQAICQANNWLLILDEVQTGIGRTGKNLVPNIVKIGINV
jgi:acetylornithine aminotransferase